MRRNVSAAEEFGSLTSFTISGNFESDGKDSVCAFVTWIAPSFRNCTRIIPVCLPSFGTLRPAHSNGDLPCQSRESSNFCRTCEPAILQDPVNVTIVQGIWPV